MGIFCPGYRQDQKEWDDSSQGIEFKGGGDFPFFAEITGDFPAKAEQGKDCERSQNVE